MVRPLRLEFAGAIHHVMARGDHREAIYTNDRDREGFLELLGSVCDRFNWTVHAYCLMSNHYHLVVETPDANLGRGMRQLNGVYTQDFNRRHRRVGHVFQGRYKGILVQRGDYLLELTRYVVLNPVRAGMVAVVHDWPWSSHRSQIGAASVPEWLDTEWLLGQFGQERADAIAAYRRFVADGAGESSPLAAVQGQLYLGDQQFGESLRALAESRHLREVSKAQRRAMTGSLAEYENGCSSRHEAMAQAYRSGAYTMKQIADYFGVHYVTVSRAVKHHEEMLECET